MYNVGDTVIYGSEGVCRISDTTERKFKNRVLRYYVLQPIYKENSEIYVPADNADLVRKMKKVLSKEEIRSLIDSMSQEKCLWIENDDERKEAYREVLKKGDRQELIQLIKAVHNHKDKLKLKGKKLHLADERFYKSAQHMLYDEFAYVLEISPNQVLPYIVGEIESK